MRLQKHETSLLYLIDIYRLTEWPEETYEIILKVIEDLIAMNANHEKSFYVNSLKAECYIKTRQKFSDIATLDQIKKLQGGLISKSLDEAEYNYRMFQFYFINGGFHEASKHLGNDLLTNELYLKGRVYCQKSEIDQALRLFRLQFDKTPFYSDNCYYLALCLDTKGDNRDADLSAKLLQIYNSALASQLLEFKMNFILDKRKSHFQLLTNSIPENSKRIFISYSWDQRNKCLQLYEILLSFGYTCWLDNDFRNPNLKVGDDLIKKLKDAISKSSIFLVFFSSVSLLILI